MEAYLYKGLFVVLLLHLSQAQDAAPPSPSPEPAPPRLADIIDAVKAAFEQAVKVSKDDAAREVFEQVVEELVPPKDIAEQSPANAENGAENGTENAMVAENSAAVQATQEEHEAVIDTSEKTLLQPNELALKVDMGLEQEQVENTAEMNTIIGFQNRDKPVPELSKTAEEGKLEIKLSNQEPTQVTDEPEDLKVGSFEPETKSDLEEQPQEQNLMKQKGVESEESTVQLESPLDSKREEERQGEEAEKRVEGGKKELDQEIVLQEQDTLESDIVAETEIGDQNQEVKDVKGEADLETAVHKMKLPKRIEQMNQMEESQPGQEQGQGLKEVTLKGVMLVEDSLEEVDQQKEVVAPEIKKEHVEDETGETQGEDKEVVDLLALEDKVTKLQKKSHKPAEVLLDTVEDFNEAEEEQESVVTYSNSLDDVPTEANDMKDMVTSRDPQLRPVEPNQGTPTPGILALPLFPTQSLELRDIDQFVEEPADQTQNTSSGPEVWKIGAIAAAFFLILQTIITVVYILKCKRKPKSRTVTAKACEEGTEGVECNVASTGSPPTAEEQSALDDLPEYSEVQQEAIAMTMMQMDSTMENSANDP